MSDAPRTQRTVAYVALGTNVGDRQRHLDTALPELAAIPESRLIGTSVVEETEAIGPVAQGPYLNQMVALDTSLSAEQLLDELLAIEGQHGRVRSERWGARTLDLDIVLFGDERITTDRLTVPHPELPNRPFWQRELTELRGGWR